MTKILIAGGAGFIGSHTAVALHENGFQPIIVDNFSNSDKSVLDGLQSVCGVAITCHEGDCCDGDFLRKVFEKEESIAGVIHFAALKAVGESVQKPLLYYKNNLGSLLTLLEVMKGYRVSPFVFSSSCTVYGQPDSCPVTEDTPIKDTPSPYGKTKQISEQIIHDTVYSGQPLKAISLRYFNPIGAHESGLIGELPIGVPNNLVPYITQTAAGIRDQLTVFGDDYDTPDGSCIRDYIHVMDLANAHVKALNWLQGEKERSCYESVNVGTGNGISVLTVIKTFEERTGIKLNYTVGPRREGDIQTVYASVNKSNELLQWKSEHDLARALEDAWRWQVHLGQRTDRKNHEEGNS